MQNSIKKGIYDGLPIGLGYLSVSFAFGILAVANGFPVWFAVLISMTNVTSAGQFAGLTLMLSGGSFIEMILTQLTINMRYALMSLSLTQKFDSSVTIPKRAFIAFETTDEIFAVSSSQKCDVGEKYMYGLMILPYIGWCLGTFLGAAAGSILPASVQSALEIALYGMFIAIIIPPAKKERPVLLVVIAAIVLACSFYWIPCLQSVSSGFVIIICALAAAGLGAFLFPIEETSETGETEGDNTENG